MAEKKFIFVCCGAGILTSFMAAEGIRDAFKKRKITNVTIQHGMMTDITRYEDKIDILVSSTVYKGKHNFPVLCGVSFITGDEKGQEEVIQQLVALLGANS
jgi:PTS system galactitol-specific IIB component